MKTFAFTFLNPHKWMRNFMLVKMNSGCGWEYGTTKFGTSSSMNAIQHAGTNAFVKSPQM